VKQTRNTTIIMRLYVWKIKDYNGEWEIKKGFAE
jgi:hypothetical protein